MIGPPNSGKTTLFNRLTGLRQKVANFPGVTVEQHTGIAALPDGRTIQLIDLPGVYSLSPRSEDEQVAHDVLTGQRADTPKPEAVLLVLDSTNMARHLMLAAPILALGLPTLVILNMADDLRSRGGHVDLHKLSAELGAPVALVSARRGEGVDQVFDFLAGAMPKPAPKELPILQDVPKCRQWAGRVGSQAAYHAPAPPKWTRRLDAVFLHPVAGPLLFLAVVVAVFQTIFSVADSRQGRGRLADPAFRQLGCSRCCPHGLPAIADRRWRLEGRRLGSGVSAADAAAVPVHRHPGRFRLPGARRADRRPHHGQGRVAGQIFHPAAFGLCLRRAGHHVDAHHREQARPHRHHPDRAVHDVLGAPAGLYPGDRRVHSQASAAGLAALGARRHAMLGLYVLGFLAAVVTAALLKSSVLKSGRTPFLLEMPSYRWPTFSSLGLRLLDRSKVFLLRAGTIILLVTVVLWVMRNVPFVHGKPPAIANSLAGTIGRTIEPVIRPLGFNWKIGIGLITAVFSRETIIATLGTIYGMDAATNKEGMQAALHHDLTHGRRGGAADFLRLRHAVHLHHCGGAPGNRRVEVAHPAIRLHDCLAYLGALAANYLIR